jgi:Raf kinase inhibitor-like YbhB/YbcL family protein
MSLAKFMIAAAAALCCTLPLGAQTALHPSSATTAAQPLLRALVSLTPPGAAKIRVSTTAWRDGGDIPFEYTQYRDNVFPGLNWTKGPRKTQSYAIIMQDVDSVRDGVRRHVLHWTMINIPAMVTSLPAAMQPDANPAGSAYGPNYKGQAQPYLGPRTPPGPKHHYRIQIFALDTMLTLSAEASYAELIERMKGHVLASGEVVGLGQADPAAQ